MLREALVEDVPRSEPETGEHEQRGTEPVQDEPEVELYEPPPARINCNRRLEPMELAAQLAEPTPPSGCSATSRSTRSRTRTRTTRTRARRSSSGSLLRLLLDELRQIGLADAQIDGHGYVTATIPATVDGDIPTIAFFAHVDTAREVTGANVRPQRIRYEGGEVPLGNSGNVIRPAESPQLATHVGHDLITTDGTTLLGADDKAGVAEIMAAAAYLAAHPEVPHGTIKVAFNPDEEVGRGVVHFPVESFGAHAAYTMDGSTIGEIQEETFSGAQVRMHIHGRSIHPGLAKGELVNAIKLAADVVARLPKERLSPETTADREGYVHPVLVSGDSSEVELRFIVRDFDDAELDRSVKFVRDLAEEGRGDGSRARRSRSTRASSTATCGPCSSAIPRSSSTSRKQFGASGFEPSGRRSAAAPTAPPSPRWACTDAQHLHGRAGRA